MEYRYGHKLARDRTESFVVAEQQSLLFQGSGIDDVAGGGDGDDLRRRRLETKLGYGVPVFGGRFTGTSEVGLSLSDTGRIHSAWMSALHSGA